MVEIVLFILAALSKAIKDLISHNYEKSIFFKYNNLFWDPSVSWKNKYKEGKKELGEKFLGSSTIFVMFTDAWHLFGMFERIFLIIGAFICKSMISLLLLYILFVVVFSATYHYFFRK